MVVGKVNSTITSNEFTNLRSRSAAKVVPKASTRIQIWSSTSKFTKELKTILVRNVERISITSPTWIGTPEHTWVIIHYKMLHWGQGPIIQPWVRIPSTPQCFLLHNWFDATICHWIVRKIKSRQIYQKDAGGWPIFKKLVYFIFPLVQCAQSVACEIGKLNKIYVIFTMQAFKNDLMKANHLTLNTNHPTRFNLCTIIHR